MDHPVSSAPSAGDDDGRSVAALQQALGPDFEVRQKLGRGSMATVYLAKEKALNRLVAVKVLLPERARDETARKRFEREARAAASLSHPNVVEVFRFGRLADETPYLVMRFVKGRTMDERLKGEGRLPKELAREVLHDVASALEVAHAHGFVHRDVRPANVMWDEERNQAMLTDFGIAAVLATSEEEVTRLTKTGQMVGDPRYLSPEQLQDEDLTELADMYAFGILGYELYTGEGPYEARTNTQWITAHLSGEPRDITRLRPDIDPAVASLLKRCLNRAPNHRPSAASAARVLAAPGSSASAGPSNGGSVEDDFTWDELRKRRIPAFVAGALAAAAGFIGLAIGLEDVGRIDPLWVDLSFPFAAAGVTGATVVAWFHGERGRQQSNVLEWILLSVIGIAWLAITVWMIVGR